MEIGKRIKAARERQGLTQKQLAEKLQISYVNISQLENGQRAPNTRTLQRIAHALDISFDNLINIAAVIDGIEYDRETQLTPAASLIGRAYEKAAPPVQRTVEVALEPYMDKDGEADVQA